MAVELTKVALWIETVEPGKPLGFLDVNVRCGDALLGVSDLKALEKGIPDDAYKPLSGDDKDTAKHFATRNKMERAGQGTFDFGGGGGRLPPAVPLAGEAQALRAMPEDSSEDIAAKRERFEAALANPHRWNLRIAADLYIAAFLVTKIGGAPTNRSTVTIPTTAHVWDALAGRTIYGPMVGRTQELVSAARAFHWTLEFPDIMTSGGFDVVLGNPPWERIKIQEQEFFATREPEIAEAPNAAVRGRMIARLKEAEPGTRKRTLYEELETTKHTAEASSVYARVNEEDAGRFPLTGRGDINTYALFAELFANLTSKRGRAGVIVPTGIATDATTAPFFAALVRDKRLVQLIDFENRDAIFPAVHRSFKFSLLTIGRNIAEANFAFFLTDVRQLAESERRFSLSADEIERINPNTKTAPVFRSRTDADLTSRIYSRVPVLLNESKGADGNPWQLNYASKLFDMTYDASLFRSANELKSQGFHLAGNEWVSSSFAKDRYVPLWEAKSLHLFDHRWITCDVGDEAGRELTSREKADPSFESMPRYWVSAAEVAERLSRHGWSRKWLVGCRKITNATNERTFISAVWPVGGAGNSLHVWLPGSTISPEKTAALIAATSSLVFDYVARQKLGGTNLNFFYIAQFPAPSPSSYDAVDLGYIVPRVLELTYTSHSMAPFARDLDYDGPPFVWDEDRRAQFRAELDAWFARAYGLTRDELRYVLDPADAKGPDYPSETFRILKKNEVARFGEYRTGRLVLQAWDRLEGGKYAT